MSQNRSSAVMQQRSEPHDSLDDFPTPPWATRALCEFLAKRGLDLRSMKVREPAANRGYMARPLAEYFGQIDASDVHDYGMGFAVRDFLFPEPLPTVDWTITNPPFKLAEQFIKRALKTSTGGVAVIVRAAFLEGQGRYENLFSVNPPTSVLQFTERVVMHKGKVTKDGSTATPYAWLIWQSQFRERGVAELRWIAPCRKQLERVGDYDLWPKEAA